MTSPTPDHHTTPHSLTSIPRRASAPARVETALTRLDVAAFQIGPTPSTDLGHVAYCLALAAISARRAGWWRVLITAQRRNPTLPLVAERAVAVAYRRARDDYRFWRDAAAEWQARAEQRPTSDAAGALSNWHELGVTA